jgi:hypothetical protein
MATDHLFTWIKLLINTKKIRLPDSRRSGLVLSTQFGSSLIFNRWQKNPRSTQAKSPQMRILKAVKTNWYIRPKAEVRNEPPPSKLTIKDDQRDSSRI